MNTNTSKLYEIKFPRILSIFRVRIHASSGTKLENCSRLNIGAGELARRWNQIEASLLNTYKKLQHLGYIIANGEVLIIESEKEEEHV